MDYYTVYQQSIQQPETFWKQQALALDWYQFPNQILSKNAQNYDAWFADGTLNLSYLCIDKHVHDGFGEQVALIYDSPVTQTIQKITFNELQLQVAKLAGGLQTLGLQKGDTALIYMPMIPQAVYSILACARLGITHSVVFGGFAPHELAIRIDDCLPKVILTASSGIEIDRLLAYKPMVDEALKQCTHQPEHVVVYNRKLGAKVPFLKNNIDYEALVYGSEAVAPVAVGSSHPSYVLYTSGTTGKPKGVVRDTGGYAVALKYSMQAIYGMQPGEVFWAASDVGWVVGHSYIVYGPLLNRNTTVLFEGKPIKTPDAGTFWRVIEEHQVKVMFTAPTAIRAIKKEDPNGDLLKSYDLSSLKAQFLAGERCDVATLDWLKDQLQKPVIDHWWQTESGWPMLANPMGIELQSIPPGSAGMPVPGYAIQIVDESGHQIATGEEGYVVVKLPLPPGTLQSIWGDHQRFTEGYLTKFPGFYFSGDGGFQQEYGAVYITGRVDDVINVAGHRLSTAEMEEVVASHAAIAECAVVGVHDELKGQVPLALAVLKSGECMQHFQLEYEVVQKIRQTIGAVASLKKVIVVTRLPKTRSGKILRKLLRLLWDQQPYTIPSTIEDEKVIDELIDLFEVEASRKSPQL